MAQAFLQLLFQATDEPTSPYEQLPAEAKIDDQTRWTDGDGSGQINRIYKADISLSGAPETLAIDFGDGTLSDLFGTAISGDELKAMAVQCTTGTIKVVAGAATGLDCFTGAQEGVILTAGQSMAIGFGAAGLDISTNAHLELTDGGAAATGVLMAITAE